MNLRLAGSALVSFAGFVTAWSSASALALPIARPGDGAEFAVAPSDQDLVDVDFTAIVALSNCSGSFVRFTTSAPTDMGMILTNGHCLENGMPRAGEAVVDRASSRTFRLLSADAQSTVATLTASRIIYATMTGTDMTLYRLNTSFADIKSRYGVDPLTIADHKANLGDPIRVVSGYWKRIYSCSVDDFVYKLREDQWTWFGSMRYKQPGCDVIGGTSGSPVINANTREVIAVNNTINESGARCTMNNPCEVNELGVVVYTRGAAYAQDVSAIYACLTRENQLDLTLPNCALQKPALD